MCYLCPLCPGIRAGWWHPEGGFGIIWRHFCGVAPGVDLAFSRGPRDPQHPTEEALQPRNFPLERPLAPHGDL